MYHLILFFVCILSLEIFVRLKFLSILNSFFKVIKNVTIIIPKKNISDHWKEKVIPSYALRMMKYSLQLLLILLLIISFFFILCYSFDEFLNLTFSLIGIIETIVFTFGCIFLRKLLIK